MTHYINTPTRQKVTVYYTSEMFGSVVKQTGYLVDHGRMKYAQYDNAPFVTFIPAKKRTAYRIVKGYNPYIIICDGWNTPEPDGMFGDPTPTGTGMIMRKSRYSCFDDGYKTDFDRRLSESGAVIIADYREAIQTAEAIA